MDNQNSYLYQYRIGTVYSREYLQTAAIESSQKNHSLIILTKPNRNEISLVCKNHIDLGCRYHLKFFKERDVNNEEGYQLIEKYIHHNSKCNYLQEKNQFDNLRAEINNLKGKIYEIVAQRYLQFGFEAPIKLLSIVAEKIGKNEHFIYDGVTNKHLRRLLKKKWDNTISQIKRYVNPYTFVKKTKRKNKNKKTKAVRIMQKSQKSEVKNIPRYQSSASESISIEFHSQSSSYSISQQKRRRIPKQKRLKKTKKTKSIKKQHMKEVKIEEQIDRQHQTIKFESDNELPQNLNPQIKFEE